MKGHEGTKVELGGLQELDLPDVHLLLRLISLDFFDRLETRSFGTQRTFCRG